MFHKIKCWYWEWYDGLNDKYPAGLAGYALPYTITHPWVGVRYCRNNIKWAWQRVFRGWDDRTIWSIDYYLDKNIPIWMRELKLRKHGVPCELLPMDNPSNEDLRLAEIEFDNILETIAIGFEAALYIQDENIYPSDPRYKELMDKFDTGFDLLHKWWGSLWDQLKTGQYCLL